MTNASPDEHDEDLVPVTLPSGGVFWVYGREVTYFNDRVRRYLEDNRFTNVSDLQELDRIITLEAICWRWGIWISQQKDYWFEAVDEKELARSLKDASGEIRLLKNKLGIDKLTRDKVRGEDSMSSYLENLRLRAREFGVMRESQLGKALELFNELKARVQLLDNTTPDEQREEHCTIDDVLDWIRLIAIPEYDAIDAHFRANQQRFWVRDQ